ncbi:hypothetical protein AURDEDRAFT_146139 [Auricularia subglabra TFB-10046 SS5]|nr:hypothetical protein AURDEDRAFT_146139 [Auricularia subglabra TFB-10046 SS5]
MSSAPSSPSPVTRTLAIIKPHAVKHRLTIERRIVEAGFEIIKERQMQFDPDGDRDTLLELFGRDADSLGLEPVWVYVLERRRAVEVWLTLMGDEDPDIARQDSPNSLRAVYGHDKHDNAFIGSPDTATAETQISVLFASSPPFPTAEADYDVDPMSLSPPRHHSSSRSVTSEGKSSHTAASSKPRYTNGHTVSPPGSGFKARPVPSTNAVPESQPRLTRAASLRLGLPVEGGREKPPVRAPRTKEELKAAFLDVPGHKRSQTINVASTAAPTVAPRPTRASVLRENKDQLQRTPTWGSARKDSVPTMDKPKPGQATFDGVPGHKRRETIQVASTAAPTVAPRPNRAAELRALKRQSMGMAPPSSFKSATPTPTPPAGPTRRSSTTSLSGKSSSSSTSSSATLVPPPGTLRRSSSAMGAASAPRSSSSLGAPKKPEIEPRTNRSALLRAKAGTPTPGRNGFK